MYCIILLPDPAGRVPTARELRLRGFVISTAVEPPPATLAETAAPARRLGHPEPAAQALALAAEETAAYGAARPPDP